MEIAIHDPHGYQRRSREPERGSALIVALLVLTIVGVLATGLAQTAVSELELAGNMRGASRAFYAADGGAEKAFHDLIGIVGANSRFPTAAELATITPPTLADASFPAFGVTAQGAAVVEPLPTGFYQGLMAQTQTYRAAVEARTTDMPPSTATVEMEALMDIIPIFQFAVFYDDDLEIFPGPTMNLNGRVHTNGDAYLGANNQLYIAAALTAAGNIYKHRKDSPSVVPTGTVQMKNKHGTYKATNGLDSKHSNWRDEAIERWDGTVRTGEQQVRRLELAIAESSDPHVLVEPGRPGDTPEQIASKLYYEADLRIVNGHATDRNGNLVSIIDPVTATSALRYSLFEDYREDKVMVVLEIDVEKLGNSAGFPANGVLYAGGFEAVNGMPAWVGSPWGPHAPPWDASDSTEFAIKLTNGDELPAPLTVVSENPLYVHGHYNRTNKKPAALVGDAVTVLSRRWGDLNNDGTFDDDWAYSQRSLGNRQANDTEVHAALMVGTMETTVGKYNGGLENLIRLLENWSGDTLTYRGSMICLWQSIYANSSWSYGTPVYTAPKRDWAFDNDLLQIGNQPPSTPDIYTLRITGWNRT